MCRVLRFSVEVSWITCFATSACLCSCGSADLDQTGISAYKETSCRRLGLHTNKYLIDRSIIETNPTSAEIPPVQQSPKWSVSIFTASGFVVLLIEDSIRQAHGLKAEQSSTKRESQGLQTQPPSYREHICQNEVYHLPPRPLAPRPAIGLRPGSRSVSDTTNRHARSMPRKERR
jgi:hypothetical protein